MEQKNSIWKNIDWFTVGLYFLLVMLGWFNIYSAVYTEEQSKVFDFSLRYGRQLIWIFASIGIIFIALIIDSKFYSSFSLIIYASVILMLVGVLVIGKATNGATSWFVIGPIKFQPSEFAKFATALAVAKYLSKYNLKPERIKTLIQFSIIAFLPSILILLQNDTGSALVFFIFFLVFFREGMPVAYLLIGFLMMTLFVLSLILETYIVLIIIEVLAFITFYISYKKYKVTYQAFLLLSIVTVVLFLGFKFMYIDIAKEYIVLMGVGISLIWFLYKIYKDKINQAYLILIVMLSSMAFTYTVDFVFDKMLDGYQQRRIKVLLGIESDPYGAGYNVNQSIIAIGSGGIAGKGYLQGTQTKFKFVPEQSTDFIFCTVGEE
jgi:rod shape determining protein RodA